MAVHNMLPPGNAKSAAVTTTVNGRKYTCAQGASIQVSDFDASVLETNGWIKTANGGTGTTAQRPVTPPIGTVYYDTTISANVIWNGFSWVHYATGASS